jgi:homogentisate 1,2-dioxygenase
VKPTVPYFRTLGALPSKRSTLFSKNGSGYYYEELIGEEGFGSDLSHAYHVNPPTTIVGAERVERDSPTMVENWPLLPRHFRTSEVQSGEDLVLGRTPLLINDDVTISFAQASAPSELFRDADGDECLYVFTGAARLLSPFGPLDVAAGDYVVVPAGVIHQWIPGDDGISALVIESRGHIKPPRRYLSPNGQFLEMAPFRERDLRGPTTLLEPRTGEADVLIRRDRRFTRMTFRYHPFDVVGWDGCVYPYAFSIHDFEPIVARIKEPPPVHQTFEGPGFVLCSFAPRPSNVDPSSINGPSNHMNIDSDEVIFYVGGDYAARSGSGIGLGSISLHPLGWTHGPHKRPTPKREFGAMLDELAVMIDTFKPLRMTSAAVEAEDAEYFATWDRLLGPENANAGT